MGLGDALGRLAPVGVRGDLGKAGIVMVLALMRPVAAMAEEGKEGEPKVAYSNLTPPLVGNYARDGGPRLRVYKADVALRVTGDEIVIHRN